jgi:hypothetical protein
MVLEATGENLVRLRLVNDVLHRAEAAEMLPQETLKRLLRVLHINNSFTFVALWVLLPAFAVVGRPHCTSSPKQTEVLRTELWHLRILIGSGSLVLVPAVAATFAFLLVTLPIIDEQSAASAAQLAAAVSTFLGATMTLVLIVATMSAFASIGIQAQRLAQRAVPDASPSDCIKWLQENGINLSPPQILASLAGTLGPLLTAPTLDLAGSLLQLAPAN